MQRRRMLAAVTGAVVVVSGLYMMMRAKPEPAKASTPFKPHALTGLSDQEKAQYALDYVQANFTNYVPPRLRFARTLTSAQMYDLGLGQPVGAAVERQIPMFTVMLQGDFGMAKPGCGASAPGAERIAGKTFKFLQLSFADDEGLVATLVANPDGRGWGNALHDPSLPPYLGPRPRMEDVTKWVKEHCPAPTDPAHPIFCPPMPASMLNPPPSSQQRHRHAR